MTEEEIVRDCYFNPWMIATVLWWDWMIFLTQQMIVTHSILHKEYEDGNRRVSS